MKQEAVETLVHNNFRALFNRMDIGEALLYKQIRKKNKKLKKEINNLKEEVYTLRISLIECEHRLSVLENNQLEIQDENTL